MTMGNVAILVGLALNALGLLGVIMRGGAWVGRMEILLNAVLEEVKILRSTRHDHGNAIVRLEERLDNMQDRVAILEDTDRQRRQD
jgi:hypothetical protein